eukprot:jgi/Tetstr1/465842/TSEL_010462.t1
MLGVDGPAKSRRCLVLPIKLGSVFGRGSFNATSSESRYDHFLNDAHGSDSYAAEMREAERILFNQLDVASGMWTVAIPTARTVMTPHELREVAAGDGINDLVPDAELSLPAFSVVTGSYDLRSLKPMPLEFKTMRYGVKYTAVPRATAVDRSERSLLGDIQRGLAARDAAWHNTEPGQKGPLRDILDMSEYTGMVFGTVGEAAMSVRASEARLLNDAIADMRMAASDLPLAPADTHAAGASADLATAPAEAVGSLSLPHLDTASVTEGSPAP